MEPRGLRLMSVHAHPDDESSKGAATLAKYVREGEQVMVVSCTGGERGDILNPRLQDDPHILRDMAQVRRDEMAAAQAIIGFEHTWLGFVDSGLPEGDPLPPLPDGCFAGEPIAVTTEALVRVIREFRPHVLLTYDETGGYPHPDHVNCHVVSMSAFAAAGDPDAYPHAGEPWQPLKLYYLQMTTRERIQRLYDLMVEREIETDYGDWLKDWKRPEREVTTRVAVRRVLRHPRPRPARPRHPGRPGRRLVPHAARDRPRGLAHRGLRARGLVCAGAAPRGRPLRGARVGPGGRRARRQGRTRAGPRRPAGPAGRAGPARQHLGLGRLMDTPSTSIGPGLGAFIAFFVLAVVLWLLMRNMNGRMRRMAYKEQQRVADMEAKEAQRERGEGRREAERAPGSEGEPPQEADRADPAP